VIESILGERLPDKAARMVSKQPSKVYHASEIRRGRYWPRSNGACYFEVRTEEGWRIEAIVALTPEQATLALDPEGKLRARVDFPRKKRGPPPKNRPTAATPTAPKPTPVARTHTLTFTPQSITFMEAMKLKGAQQPANPFMGRKGEPLGSYWPCGNVTVLTWRIPGDWAYGRFDRLEWSAIVDGNDRLREGVTLVLD
jgi:hypothetical protein